MKILAFILATMTASSAFATFNIYCYDQKQKGSYLHIEYGDQTVYISEYRNKKRVEYSINKDFVGRFGASSAEVEFKKRKPKKIVVYGDFGANGPLEYVELETDLWVHNPNGTKDPTIQCSSLHTAD